MATDQKSEMELPSFTSTVSEQAETDALVKAALRFAETEIFELDAEAKPEVIVIPAGRTIKSLKPFLDEYRTRPERKAGTSELTTVASFVAQVNRSKDANTVIFADVVNRKEPKLLAVFDYNESGPIGAPRFGKHRALYRFPVSVEWAAWTGRPLENMGQVEFADFLENRIMDVLDPLTTGKTLDAFCSQLGIKLASPQRIMELSKGLTIHADHKVIQNVNIGSGEMQLGFSEDHKDQTGAPLKIPGGFAIAIPVFRGGAPYQIPVRLRYKLKDGEVRWTLQPQRIDEVWDDAINESVSAVTTATDLVTLFGTPEN